ncbi:MAG: hypothetical protein ACYS21_13985, partial [Planctomycetota bacterium]
KMMRRLVRRLNQPVFGREPCPEIQWDDVVRIYAIGSNAMGPFDISVTFTHRDGKKVTIFVHTKGYYAIIKSLSRRFPSIPEGWYDEMMARPDWYVERELYSRD